MLKGLNCTGEQQETFEDCQAGELSHVSLTAQVTLVAAQKTAERQGGYEERKLQKTHSFPGCMLWVAPFLK